MRILVVGATGMLGYSLFSNLSEYSEFEVFGSVRTLKNKEHYFKNYIDKLYTDIDVTDLESVGNLIESCKPEVVINCIGLIKQHEVSKQHIDAIQINSLLPHQLARQCDSVGAKLIHFSTDCIFDGSKGNYLETDLPTARDLYGKSKSLGEVDYGRHLTLRTSIIGHELSSSVSLVDWFLSQKDETKGFEKAVFSGLPTCYIAKILAERVLSSQTNELSGLYHLSAEPIDKNSLITIISEVYQKDIQIHKCSKLVIDRSLESSLLRDTLKLDIPQWRELIEYMYSDYIKRYQAWRN